MNTLIVSGGNLTKEFLIRVLEENDFNNIIAADRGLEVLDKINIIPDYIIGDFDSVNKQLIKKYNKVKIIELNPEKDYTDTHIALKKAIELNSNNIIIVGAIGTRIDHSIANIHILKEALEKNILCTILNENNKIQLINKNATIFRDDNYKYVSLVPLTNNVENITLNGFKYPLKNATLKIGQSIGVSNEQIEEKANIELKSGILILIQSKD